MFGSLQDIFISIIFPVIGDFLIIFFIMHSMKQLDMNQKRPLFLQMLIPILYSILITSVSDKSFLIPFIISTLPFIGRFLYHNDSRHFRFYIFLCIVFFISNSMVNIIYLTISEHGFLKFTESFYTAVFRIIAIHCLEFLFLRLASFILWSGINHRFYIKQWFPSFLLPVFSIIYIYTLLLFCQTNPGTIPLILLFIGVISIIGLHMYISTILKAFLQDRLIRTPEILLSKQDEEWDEKDWDSFGKAHYTNCQTLNIVLNDKTKEMQEHDILFTTYFDEFSLDFMKNKDIEALFNDLLDHAIKAAKRAKPKYVRLRIEYSNKCLGIHITNTYIGKIHKANHSFRQRHKEPALQQVNNILFRYRGELHFEYNATESSIHIAFPEEQSQKFTMGQALLYLMLAMPTISPTLTSQNAKPKEVLDKNIVAIKAKNIVNLLNVLDFDTILTKFVRDDLKDHFPKHNLERMAERIYGNAGNLTEFLAIEVVEQEEEAMNQNWFVATVLVQFEQKPVTFTISFDKDTQLIGLVIT